MAEHPSLTRAMVEWEIRHAAVTARSTSFSPHAAIPMLLCGGPGKPWILEILNGDLKQEMEDIEDLPHPERRDQILCFAPTLVGPERPTSRTSFMIGGIRNASPPNGTVLWQRRLRS